MKRGNDENPDLRYVAFDCHACRIRIDIFCSLKLQFPSYASNFGKAF
jgi:hypothetical protein